MFAASLDQRVEQLHDLCVWQIQATVTLESATLIFVDLETIFERIDSVSGQVGVPG
jgi:hypothetical protein